MANLFHTSHGLVPIDSSDFAPTFNGFYITHGLVPTDGTPPIPSITSVSPNICKHTDNCTVTIVGVNFGSQQGNGQVFFGPDEAATYVSWIDTQIVVTAPTKTGLRDIIDYVRVKRNGDTTDEVPDAIRFYHDGLRFQEITATLNAATGAETAASNAETAATTAATNASNAETAATTAATNASNAETAATTAATNASNAEVAANNASIEALAAKVAAESNQTDLSTILPQIQAIFDKLPAGDISGFSLADLVDGISVSDILEILLSMANGRFKKDEPSPGFYTFYRRDNVTPLYIMQITETERTRQGA